MKLLAALVMLLTLSACSLPVFFRVPVVQGNVVTAKEVSKLKLGMTKSQVKYILGTPLIDPSFEKDRWDYVFYYRNPRNHVRHSKLELYFDNGSLSSIQGSEEYTAQLLKNTQQSRSASAPSSGNTTPGTATSKPVKPSPRTAPNPASNISPSEQQGPNSAGSAAPVIPKRSPNQSQPVLSF